jgi:uncharacterized protein YbjT (DUF2867 family)
MMSGGLVVFGAHGATGQILTKAALAQGYHVTAATRRPEHLEQQMRRELWPSLAGLHAELRVVRADIYDSPSVAAAIAGQDAVVCLVSEPFSWKPITVYSQAASAIVQGMRTAGVRRVLFTTSGGTNPRYDPAEGFFFGRLFKPTIGRTAYQDMRVAEVIVRQSGLDWTIVRPARLFTQPSSTPYHVVEGFVVPGKVRTARADLARFLLDHIAQLEYQHKAVAIASELS